MAAWCSGVYLPVAGVQPVKPELQPLGREVVGHQLGRGQQGLHRLAAALPTKCAKHKTPQYLQLRLAGGVDKFGDGRKALLVSLVVE